MKNMKFQLGLAFVCIVLGLALTIQFKTIKSSVGPVSEYRVREVAAQLKKVTEERNSLMKVNNEYQQKIRDFENSAANVSSSAQLIKKELDNARVLAGLEDVQGPGIIIKLDDLKFGEKVNFPLIDSGKLLEFLNELNAAGAEAVSINDQRIIASTEIRQIGGIFVNINTVKFAPPYTFKAIGDPKTLEASLRFRGGPVDSIEQSGVVVDIKQQQNIVITKFNGIIDRKYSNIVKGVK